MNVLNSQVHVSSTVVTQMEALYVLAYQDTVLVLMAGRVKTSMNVPLTDTIAHIPASIRLAASIVTVQKATENKDNNV